MLRGLILLVALIVVGIVIVSGFVNGYDIETVLLRGGVVMLFFSVWGVVIAVSVASIKSEVDRKENEKHIANKLREDEERRARRNERKEEEVTSRY